MNDMPIEDVRRDLISNVIMYKNKPTFVSNVTGNGDVFLIDLLSQKNSIVQFDLKEFTNPTHRLGFINVRNAVVYGSRIPVRKYYLGLCNKNVKFSSLEIVYEDEGWPALHKRLQTMCCPEIGEALLNKYPTFLQALNQVKKFKGAVAFDKQFAVRSDGRVLYKTYCVGKVSLNAKSVDDIVFSKGNEHLIMLLEKNYEKAISDIRAR